MKTVEQFWAKVEKTDNCWNWTGGTDGSGRGILTWQGRRDYAYRVAYEIAKGKPPNGIRLTQSCKNLRCVRDEHLTEKVTKKAEESSESALPVSAAPAVTVRRKKRREKLLLPKEKPIPQPKESRLLALLSEFREEIEKMESGRNEALLAVVDLRNTAEIMVNQLSPIQKALENARGLLASPSIVRMTTLGRGIMDGRIKSKR